MISGATGAYYVVPTETPGIKYYFVVVTNTKSGTSATTKSNTVTATINIPLTSVGVNVASNQITGTTTAMQYSLDSTNGTDGTWTNASATNTQVTFTAGKVYVRQTTVPTHFRLVATIAAPAVAPTGINVNIATGQITGTKATQQYSLNGGTTWNDASETNTAVTFATGNSIVVREKVTASAFASASTTPITVAAPATAPAANKAQGTAGGTIKLTGLANGVTYEYVVDSNATLAANAPGWSGATSVTLSGTEIDNIAVTAGQYVHLRVKATAAAFASNVQNVQIVLGDINPAAALGVTVADALGFSNDGKGTITTPALPLGATEFKYQVNATAPTVTGGQSTATGWISLIAGATSAPIALTNGQVVTVATVDALGNIIAIQNITVAGIANYIPGQSAVKTGTATVRQNGSFSTAHVPFVLNGVTIPLTNLHRSNAAANAASVATALQADIAAVFTGTPSTANGNSTQTFTVTTNAVGTGTGSLIITAPSLEGIPIIALTGSNTNLMQFLGLTANTIAGTSGSN